MTWRRRRGPRRRTLAPPLLARLPNATPRTALHKDAPCPTSDGSRDLSGQCKIPPEHAMHKASGFTYIKPDARVKLVPAEDISYVLHGKPFGRTVDPAKLQKVHSRLSVTSSTPPKAMTPLTPKAMAPLTHKASAPLTHKDATPITLKDTLFPTCDGNRGHSGQCKKPPEHVTRMASGGTYIKPDARLKLIPAEYITYVQHSKLFGRTVGSAKLQKGHRHKALAPLTHKAMSLGAPCPTSGGSRDLSGQCKIPPEHAMDKASGFTYIKPDARVKLVPAEDIPYVLHGKPFGRTSGPAKLQKVHSRLSVTPSTPPKAMTPLTPKAMAPLTHKASTPLTHKDATPITLKDTLFLTCGGIIGHSGQCKKPPEHVTRKASGGTYIKPDARVKLIPAEYITYVQHGKPFGRTVGSAKLQKGHRHKALAPLTHKAMPLRAPFPTCGGKRDFSRQCQKAPDHVGNLGVDSPPGFPLDVPPGFTRAHCGLCREEVTETHIGSFTGIVLDTPRFSLDAPGFTAACCGLNTNGTTSPPESDTDEIGTQIFINFGGSSISSQENLNKLNAGMLMRSALNRLGVQTHDFYCECSGKYLDKGKLLSDYPIERDSTIKVRPRLRAGNRRTKTWDQIIGRKPRHHVVPLSPRLIGTKHKMDKIQEARFVHGYIQYNAREHLISLCEKNSRGKSLNGRFTSTDILFKAGKSFFADHLVEVDFTLESCRNDYLTTHDIFYPVFWDNNLCGLHAEHLLKFLWTCPAGVYSRSEKVIVFLTNHIALLNYSDRMAVCSNLDGMILRLLGEEYIKFLKLIIRPNWQPIMDDVPAMKDVLEFACKVDPRTHQRILTYTKDGDQPVHFAAKISSMLRSVS